MSLCNGVRHRLSSPPNPTKLPPNTTCSVRTQLPLTHSGPTLALAVMALTLALLGLDPQARSDRLPDAAPPACGPIPASPASPAAASPGGPLVPWWQGLAARHGASVRGAADAALALAEVFEGAAARAAAVKGGEGG